MKDETRKSYAEQLVPFAREYLFSYEGINVTISRYNNHGRLLPDDGWMVSVHGSRQTSTTNHHYLTHSTGEWRYKCGDLFASAEDALASVYKWGTPNRALRLEEQGPDEAKLEAEYRV